MVSNLSTVTTIDQCQASDAAFPFEEGVCCASASSAPAPVDTYAGPDDQIDPLGLLAVALAGQQVVGIPSFNMYNVWADALKEFERMGDKDSVDEMGRLNDLIVLGKSRGGDGLLKIGELAKQLGEKLAARGSLVEAIGLYDLSVTVLKQAHDQLGGEISTHNFASSDLKQPDNSISALGPFKLAPGFVGPNMEKALSELEATDPIRKSAILWSWSIVEESYAKNIGNPTFNTLMAGARLGTMSYLRQSQRPWQTTAAAIVSSAASLAEAEAGTSSDKPTEAKQVLAGKSGTREGRPEEDSARRTKRAKGIEEVAKGVKDAKMAVEKERKPR